MPVPYDLSGRVALVTGASSGIGLATALELARCGARVALHCHASLASAQAAKRQIVDSGGEALVVQADLALPEQAATIVDRTVERFGRLDILFNNAGTVISRAKIEDCPLDLWQQILTVNLTSAFVVTQRAIPHLRSSGKGAIVNNLSLAVQTGGANGAGPYAAAKGGLLTFTRTLARELAPAVRANAIMPGVVETRHHEQFTTADRMEQYRAETPLGRNGTAEEVAAAVLFLVSDASRFLNGALIDINGGRFLR
ncbi:MAG: SDR family NAD(P)-dependent oxidoreductase [Pirellulaceae bacterium]|nr:SDR family NAD(P)-dependent oxidoreductase [Pirellulaceae bacterium]